ncbi:hypothetical protein-transmembrane prediction [Rhodopirellula baltica SH 1]|uniref:Uncharacterized protein n=1 Tax=Rhodopirellula baltica (strain DSM 10527 / NCIMB 13988 / SH1) TaxID=243090 RepID=Q7UVU7_RHOBA|nr:hypothetical protein-transmembrane prediction [Rhodopirellula baltica SH 1]
MPKAAVPLIVGSIPPAVCSFVGRIHPLNPPVSTDARRDAKSLDYHRPKMLLPAAITLSRTPFSIHA